MTTPEAGRRADGREWRERLCIDYRWRNRDQYPDATPCSYCGGCKAALIVATAIAQAEAQERAEENEACALAALAQKVSPAAQHGDAMNALEHIDAALTPAEGSTLCGVKGCTLPSTHGDEPHSWEPPTGGPPPEGSA
jgi:hypothetical protein